jgi:GNAT superfamily N-acetyltransferase
MPGAVTRVARRSDAAAIAGVHGRAWSAAYRELMPEPWLHGMTLEGSTTAWDERLAQPERRPTFVAEDEAGSIVGFVSLATPARDDDVTPETAEIAALYVDPPSWRAGVGAALLETAWERLRREGFENAILWVLVGNEPARRFYERYGFVADGTVVDHDPPGAPAQSGLRAARMRAALI